MDIWKILGIEETKEQDALKTAYRNKLTGVNPEDDPEGFMQLRQAYEEALRLSELEEDTNNQDDSNNELYKEIDRLYHDFGRRITISAWQELFDRDEFVSLDNEALAFDTLMRYLMDNFHIPQKVWKFIVEYFDISGRKKELCERYPEDFIGYAINNATYDDMISYYLFDGNEDEYDDFIEKYYSLDSAVRKREIDKQGAIIEEIEELDVYHPYLEVCKIRHRIQQLIDKAVSMTRETGDDTEDSYEEPSIARLFPDELKELQVIAEELCEQAPEDIFVINACGDVAMVREDYEEAKEYYDRTALMEPDNYMVKGKQAELLYYLGEYEKARDAYMDLLKINHFDNNVRAGMIRANQGLIGQLKAKLETDPSDDKSRMEMAWSYYQSYQFNEAIEVLDQFTPDDEKICEYNNVKGRTYLCLQDYNNALKCFEIWKKAIEELPMDDNSEETEKKRKRYEYVNFLIGDCYLKTKRYDEAQKYIDTAMQKEHDEIVLSYEARCELFYEIHEYEQCLDACEALLEREDRSYIAYNYMSKAYYGLGYLKECMSCCEHAIAIYPYVAEPYCQEICVFLNVNQPDSARNVVERYKTYGIESDNMDYHEARILAVEDRQKEAVELLYNTIKRSGDNPEESDMEDYSELHMLIGFCLEDLNQIDKAYMEFEKAVKINPEHKAAYGKMAYIERNSGNYDEAIKLYTTQLKYNEQALYYINRGLIQNYKLNFKSAMEDFNSALLLEPDNAYCHLRLGLIYEKHREFNKALESYDAAIMYTDGEAENGREQLADIYALKARTLQCMNNFEESKKVYEYYFDNFGLNADIAYDCSELYMRMKLIDEAADLLNKCINTLEYSDDIQAAIRQLCSIYGNEGYIDKANECFRLAISKNPKDVRAYATMGEVFANHGLFEDARKLYEKAVALDVDKRENYYGELIEAMLAKRTFFKPDVRSLTAKAMIPLNQINTPMDYIKMARLFRVLKKTKESVEMIQKGLKCRRCSGCFYGKCHELWFEWALLSESMRDYATARKCYKEAIKICGHNTLYEERLKRIENK